MKKLSDDQFKNLITSEIRSALTFIDSTIAKRRERNAAYYNIDLSKDLPAITGQSSVTDGTMAAQIGMMMPQLMRIMCGGPQIFVYEPNGLVDEPSCKEATQYVNDVVMRLDNQGEDVVYQLTWDGLVQIVGVVKAYWEQNEDVSHETFENLNDMQLAQLLQKVQGDSRYEVTAYEEEMKTAEVQVPGLTPDAEPQMIAQQVRNHTVTVTKTVNRSKVCIENVPPEEFVISADARSLESATLKSHRREMTIGELIDMGFTEKELADIPTAEMVDSVAEANRRNLSAFTSTDAGDSDPMLRQVIVHQGIVKCNYDGSGLKDWYFMAAGTDTGMTVLETEEYDYQVVFADFCSDPIPHTFFGRCTADNLVEPTKAKTAVLRQTMQNMYLVNSPYTLLNSASVMKGTLEAMSRRVPGGMAVIQGDPNVATREVVTPFVGQYSLPILAYLDQEAAARTGVSRASAGLDPDLLTNQTATAANILESAAQGRIEMIARILATGAMRKLGRGILRILKRYQDFAREVRVGNTLKQVDPRQWAEFEDWDCTVQTGLGTGNKEKDGAMIMAVMQKAELLFQTLGPNNGIVSVGQYSQMFTALLESFGVKAPEKFATALPVQYSPQPQPPQPTPDAELYAKVEAQKTQQKNAEAAGKIQSSERVELAKLASDERKAKWEIESKVYIEKMKLGQQAESHKLEFAKLGLEGIKTDVDAAYRGKELDQKAKEKTKPAAKIDMGMGGVKKGLKKLEGAIAKQAEGLARVERVAGAPRVSRMRKGKDGSKEAISEVVA